MAKRDILEQARANMLQQFTVVSAPNMDKILKISAEELQEAEDVSYQLLMDRTLNAAGGVQLDSLGLLLNLRRSGKPDIQYREALRLKVVINNSGGQASTLIALLKSLIPEGGLVEITELFPAAVQVYADELTLPPAAIQQVGDVLAATVSLSIVTAEDNPFTMYGSIGGGFGSIYDLEVGGRFVQTISGDNPVIIPDFHTFMAASGGVDSIGGSRGYSPELPWATLDFSYRNTASGWTVGLNEGVYPVSSFTSAPFGNGRSVSSWEPRKATLLQTNSSLTTAVFGTSYLVPETITMSGFIIDSAGLANDCVLVTASSGMSELVLSDMQFKNPVDSAFQCNRTAGVFTVDSCNFDFDMNKSVVDGSFFAESGSFEWNITNNQFVSLVDDPDVDTYIGGTRAAAPVGIYKCKIEGNTIDLDITSNTVGQFYIVKPLGADSASIVNNTISVTTAAAGELACIRAYGEYGSALAELTIAGNSVYTEAPASFGIALGNGVDTGYVRDGVVQNNVVIGKYFATSTPHGFAATKCKSDQTWVIKNNFSAVSFVGYLCSQNPSTTAVVFEDNLAYDCYGPHYYAKGNTDALIQNNRAVQSDKYQRRSFGMLHATKQGSDNNIDTQFLNNEVVIQSKLKGFALAGTSLSGGVSQNATFIGNKYYVPDTLNDTTDLFIIDNAFKNITEWLAVHPDDADDGAGGHGLIYLPQADIDLMVEAAEADVVAAYGSSIPE